ncbi:MAG TPA: endolytic transglycosylase MltG [Anaerolineae bacterium]|nr:endolytic transglycosylase MltG [Anaerolineae bacterium]
MIDRGHSRVNTFARLVLRLVTLVLAISVIVAVLGGSLWYVWQDARGQAPEVGYTIRVEEVEKLVHKVILLPRGAEIARPVDPDDSRERTFVVEWGESVTQVAYHLEREGLIADAEVFRHLVQSMGAERNIERGVFSLRPSMTMEEIAIQLQHGRLPSASVTVLEGWRAEEIAGRLEEEGVTSGNDFLAVVRQGRGDYDFLRDRPPGSPVSVEGFLFPDTYEFPLDTTPGRVIEIMLQNWDRRVPPEERQKAADQDFSLYEVVSLAAIVEREAVVPEERSLIAGVYLNRLRAGMYLQADPTVQYAKGYDPTTDGWWSHMKQEEASTVDSPYNTFLNPGLPPGPICNPGLASIEAVLEPTPTEYLFFYHKGDGTHAFAVTYDEHLRNQERYGGK